MDSTAFYNFSVAGYVSSLMLFAIHVVNTRRFLLKLGVLSVAISFLVQTLGMLMRWIEAGFLEVSAAEKALGQALAGWSWFVVFTQHPPWSNLYEIMVYMSWGIIIVTLAAELKWQIAWVRHMGLMLALMALGMAALTDASIKPLVPALKSWWIMIHVISASIAYAAGCIAAFMCLCALMKDTTRVRRQSLSGLALVLFGVLLFSLGGGLRLFLNQAYFVKLLAQVGENLIPVMDLTKERGASYLVPMPMLGFLFILAVCCHLFLGSLLVFLKNNDFVNSNVAALFGFCFLSVALCFLAVLFHDIRQSQIVVDSAIVHHLSPAGPWFISFKSHPWSFGLLVFTFILEGFVLLFLLWPHKIIDRLPSVSALEMASYKAISLSFFLMTIVLITGALWAHYAWGRYWAWDPKETGALAIWINYAIYLHARRTSGFSGPFSSLIGIFGFFVIVIGFLGVNLGLFADGLHTYGNG